MEEINKEREKEKEKINIRNQKNTFNNRCSSLLSPFRPLKHPFFVLTTHYFSQLFLEEESDDEGHEEHDGSEPKSTVVGAVREFAVLLPIGLEGAKVALDAGIADVIAELLSKVPNDRLIYDRLVSLLAVGAVHQPVVLEGDISGVLGEILKESIDLLLAGQVAVVIDLVRGFGARLDIRARVDGSDVTPFHIVIPDACDVANQTRFLYEITQAPANNIGNRSHSAFGLHDGHGVESATEGARDEGCCAAYLRHTDKRIDERVDSLFSDIGRSDDAEAKVVGRVDVVFFNASVICGIPALHEGNIILEGGILSKRLGHSIPEITLGLLSSSNKVSGILSEGVVDDRGSIRDVQDVLIDELNALRSGPVRSELEFIDVSRHDCGGALGGVFLIARKVAVHFAVIVNGTNVAHPWGTFDSDSDCLAGDCAEAVADLLFNISCVSVLVQDAVCEVDLALGISEHGRVENVLGEEGGIPGGEGEHVGVLLGAFSLSSGGCSCADSKYYE